MGSVPNHCNKANVAGIFCLFCQCIYHILLCIMHTHIFGADFQGGNLSFKFLNSVIYLFIYLFIYLYLETKPMIIFQGIILCTDVAVAF